MVDYLQLVTTGDNSQKNRVQEVSEIGGLKALAMFRTSHHRPVATVTSGRTARGQAAATDLRESASIEQDADRSRVRLS